MFEDQVQSAWLEDDAGGRIELPRSLTIGRAPANALVLRDHEQRVSSYHARIERDAAGRFFAEDRHSTNGTFVNERKIVRHELHAGDRLRFGSRVVFTFRVSGEAPDATGRFVTADATLRHYEERDCWFLIGDIKGSSRLAVSLDGIALARLVSDWASACRMLAERHGGAMTNRTGDGWLVLWDDGPGVAGAVAAALRELRAMQRVSEPPFRLLVHRGRATLAGSVCAGEENVLSSELHRAFRMEKIAARLEQNVVASEAAAASLREVIECRLLSGVFELPGFPESHRLFQVGGD